MVSVSNALGSELFWVLSEAQRLGTELLVAWGAQHVQLLSLTVWTRVPRPDCPDTEPAAPKVFSAAPTLTLPAHPPSPSQPHDPLGARVFTDGSKKDEGPIGCGIFSELSAGEKAITAMYPTAMSLDSPGRVACKKTQMGFWT